MGQRVRASDGSLKTVLGPRPRLLLALAALLVIPTYFAPLWTMTMFAPQYPDGLRLFIYSHRLDGGNAGQDLVEVNILNHYIGMRELEEADFSELRWLPFTIAGLGLLVAGAAISGRASHLVAVMAFYGCFAAVSAWSFASKLYGYGHGLAPTASVKVAPFMPPLFGHKTLANFDVYSYPGPGAYALAGIAVALVAALLLGIRSYRRSAA